MSGIVESIHIVRVKHGTPEPIDEAQLVPGRGIPGDHHDRPGIRRAVTLICAETLEGVGRKLRVDIVPGRSRRNITVRGLDLDALAKGTRLSLGNAELEVTGPCDPCERMETAIGPGALKLMEHRGGIVTKIVGGGRIKTGDAIRIVEGGRTSKVQLSLLNWFRREQRELPWRRTKDPYSVWISEVMCQQTQVATVIPYWERFLAKFPTVQSLAAAPVDDVLALWSGLGYYARARNLHRAAQAVVERHGGSFPADLDALKALPGFGPYTAGAVGSIALGLDAALVDGNVARVFCRIEGWALGAEEAREKAWDVAPELVAKGQAGDWNQALMELGATICTPAAPSCDRCPVRSLCVAAKRGEPAKYPLPKVRRPRKELRLVSLAIRDADSVLLLRREGKGLFGGLWELPTTVLEGDSVETARTAAKEILGGRVSLERLGVVTATLTHRDVEVEIFSAAGSKLALPEGARFVAPAELPTLGLSTLAVRVLAAARVDVPQGHGRRRAVSTAQRSLFGERGIPASK
jgi:A/G-specific adenine glycosylase